MQIGLELGRPLRYADRVRVREASEICTSVAPCLKSPSSDIMGSSSNAVVRVMITVMDSSE